MLYRHKRYADNHGRGQESLQNAARFETPLTELLDQEVCSLLPQFECGFLMRGGSSCRHSLSQMHLHSCTGQTTPLTLQFTQGALRQNRGFRCQGEGQAPHEPLCARRHYGWPNTVELLILHIQVFICSI
jgi:hypothetical protein